MATIGEVLFRLRGDTSDADRALRRTEQGLDRTQSRMDRFASRMEQISSRMTSVGSRLSIGITAPLALAAGAASRTAAVFDESMTRINTLVGVSRDQVSAWRDEVREVGRETGRGPNELAEALFAITSAGARGAEAMGILEASAKASAIGLGETRSVALAVTGAMTAFAERGLTANKAVETLFLTVREGNLAAEELAAVLPRVFALGREAGADLADIGGFIATVTRLGTKPEQAATQLEALFRSLVRPQPQVTKALAEVGLSLAQLREQIEREGLPAALETLRQAFHGNKEALATVLPDTQALIAVLGTGGPLARVFAESVGKMRVSTEQFQNAFEVTTETTSQNFRQLRANLEDLAIGLGNVLAPSLNAALDASRPVLGIVKGLIEGFQTLPDMLQGTAIAFLGLAGAVGPVAFIGGQLIQGIKTLIGLGPATIRLLGTLGKLLGPTGLIAVGAIAAAGGIALVVREFLRLQNAAERTERILNRITDTAAGAAGSLGGPLQLLGAFAAKQAKRGGGGSGVPGVTEEAEKAFTSLMTSLKDQAADLRIEMIEKTMGPIAAMTERLNFQFEKLKAEFGVLPAGAARRFAEARDNVVALTEELEAAMAFLAVFDEEDRERGAEIQAQADRREELVQLIKQLETTVTSELMTEAERRVAAVEMEYAERVRIVNEAVDRGIRTEAQATQLLINAAESRSQRLKEINESTLSELTEFQIQAFRNMQSAMSSILRDALQGQIRSWEDLGDRVKAVLDSIVAEFLALQVKAALFGQNFGTSGGQLGGLVGSISGGIGSFFGGGGGDAFTGGFLDLEDAQFFGGALQHGGRARAGQAFIVGEKEPEIFFPDVSGMVVPMSRMRGEGGGDRFGPFIFQGVSDFDSFKRSRPQLLADLGRAVQRARKHL